MDSFQTICLPSSSRLWSKDGHLDLLVTNHAAVNGSVFAYTFDSEDLETANVSRHVLATGFSPFKVDKGKASPGALKREGAATGVFT